uniref:Uncharacterized protein n=1 Tax=Panagrolaimus sp. PS1159 TaxID=55785 RepID=A0AC35EXT0_9BILA
MKKQLLALLLILISLIVLSAGAPVSSESDQTPATTNEVGKWWDILREHVLFPAIKLIDMGDSKTDFKSASSNRENSSTNFTTKATTTTTTEEPSKFFAFIDSVLYEIGNLTFLGYIYIGVLVILLLIIFCCTGCCCCCCGCCRCR